MYIIFTRYDMPPGYIIKLLVIMKLTVFILITTLMQVSAATFGQKVILKENNLTIERVFKEIHKQTGYYVLMENSEFKSTRVNTKFQNTPLNEVMDFLVKETDLTYTIEENTVVIKKKVPSFLERLVERWASIDVRGIVVDEKGLPLVGATVKVKGTEKRVVTGEKGEFYLQSVEERAVLVISYLGYESKEITANKDIGAVRLILSEGKLDEVTIVSTGYQEIPKERATGSFTVINNQLINRAVSTNIMDRLVGVSSGLLQNDGTGNNLGISIRGRSTIFANTQPLIVVDNFPYDGDINNINPNDIENVTLLKDAAAASIWGARSGNGVIVITTKKGSYNGKTQVSLNSNVTIGGLPKLSYVPNISTSGYIEMEKLLFSNGFYAQIGGYNQPALTPIVEILIRQRNNEITEGEANTLIAKFNHDSRDDFKRYLYRKPVNQQYALNLNGGTQNQKYYLSAGLDKNLNSLKGNGLERLTLNANNTYSFLNNKLEITTGIMYMYSNVQNNGISPGSIKYGSYNTLYPYARLSDDQGNHLSIPKYRQIYLDTAGGGKLLDWNYRPLDELALSDNTTTQNDVQASFITRYKFSKQLSFDLKYLYGRGNSKADNVNAPDSYYTRNLINRYSSISGDVVTRPIPLGAILNRTSVDYKSQNLRAQANYSNAWDNNNLDFIAGAEIKDLVSKIGDDIIYGYDKKHTNGSPVDNVSLFPNYVTGNSMQIPYGSFEQNKIDRYVSFFGNIAYTYKKRYIISASARQDASNLIGVNSNQKWVPLWSVGGSWILSDEKFYQVNWLNYLKIRATYGYNGNVDKSVAAYLVTQQLTNNVYGNPTSYIQNSPNPDLRWERIGMLNLALDYSLFNNRLSGSFDYYFKSGFDLMGFSSLAPSTGLTVFKGNTSNMKGRGVDIVINSKNMDNAFKWSTSLLLSTARDKVTAYNVNPTTISDYIRGSSPIVGKTVYPVFSYRAAGLDAQTGDPIGYLNGAVSKEYGAILLSANHEDMVYNGSLLPTIFGSVQNAFTYKNFSLSFLLTYKLGYFFRKSSVNYDNLLNGFGYGHVDFDKRWKKPGDERITSVPSLIYPNSTERDEFYSFSESLVEKGDHLRLKDIQIAYSLNGKFKNTSLFNSAHIYVYLNNLGIIWKANKSGIDPDMIPTPGQYSSIPLAKTIALGLKIDL
ncbi:SusC/RagA family TonB-linked outer membrane protein [Pedobacter nyackensis]|uniref:TonB-linked outer membrane protein, SusC/RagA family n=1 Tax=Pedobacter nyackensis TaxID=475255 RepID=A0A1W2A759_9SPHI|nr:SusC/RagA family TonB-linked outer membrane protein [Pedobacter nyackensis]SMC56500.1 TonB-linked outer membrane protein, SusC/RagA family [Pedobacter nyackensis]